MSDEPNGLSVSARGDLADFADEDFVTIRSFPHMTQMTVMPVVAMKGDNVRAVGTCFAISSQGLVLTARHVIEDALKIGGGGKMAEPRHVDRGALHCRDGRGQHARRLVAGQKALFHR